MSVYHSHDKTDLYSLLYHVSLDHIVHVTFSLQPSILSQLHSIPDSYEDFFSPNASHFNFELIMAPTIYPQAFRCTNLNHCIV